MWRLPNQLMRRRYALLHWDFFRTCFAPSKERFRVIPEVTLENPAYAKWHCYGR